MMMNVRVMCVPQSAQNKPYIVARVVEGGVWFYSAWKWGQEEEAYAQALEVGGFVVENPDWLKDIFQS